MAIHCGRGKQNPRGDHSPSRMGKAAKCITSGLYFDETVGRSGETESQPGRPWPTPGQFFPRLHLQRGKEAGENKPMRTRRPHSTLLSYARTDLLA